MILLLLILCLLLLSFCVLVQCLVLFTNVVLRVLSILALPTLAGGERAGPKAIKLASCSPQLSMKFILLITVKMPTIVGILAFISMINTPF